MNIDTRIKGEITEMKCQLFCLEQGYIISKPILDNARYDLLLDYNGKIYRIQIKTSRWKNENKTGIIFNCYSVSNKKKHNYTKDEIDYFATFWEGKCYLVPVEECSSEKTLWFEEKTNPSCCLAKDYDVLEVIKTL